MMRWSDIASSRYASLFLIVLCLGLWLPGFGSLPPGDRDESRFAQASRQMNETGDYVRILNGTVARNRKPIGIYWMQAAAARVVGAGLENPIWPYRVPSLLGGVVAVLAAFRLGLVVWGSRGRAFLAAAMLAGCVILAAETHIAKTDAALLGATTLAMGVLARAWMGVGVSRWQAALFWAACGAGILIKGPITPMVAGLCVAALCVWERRVAWLRGLRAGWGVPLMLAMVAPWFVAIGVATGGAFFAQSVGGDLAGKLAGGAEAHGGFVGLHLLLLPLLAFPSSALVLAAVPAAWRDRREAATRFLIAWVVPSWLVFEAVPTKLPHYTLPLYPALFLLAARFCDEVPAVWVRRVARGGLVLAGVGLAAAVVSAPVWLGQAWWLGVPAFGFIGLALWLAWAGRPALAVVAAVGVYAAILQLELPRLSPLWIAPRVEALLRQDWPGWNAMGDGLAVAGYAEPGLVFLTGTHTQLLPNGAAAAAALAGGTASLAIVTDREVGAFLAAGARVREVGEVRGFNYSRGRWVILMLFSRGE